MFNLNFLLTTISVWKDYLTVLDGDAKKSVEVIGTSRIFYATALKCLKRDYRNSLVITHLRFKALFDRPQLKVFDRSGLRQFHQQLKTNNTWLLSNGYESPLLSCENLTKCISLLPLFLQQEFYKSTDSSIFTGGSVNLIVFEQWSEKKVKQHFKPTADVIAVDERFEQKLSSKKLIYASFGEEISTKVNYETNTQSNIFVKIPIINEQVL